MYRKLPVEEGRVEPMHQTRPPGHKDAPDEPRSRWADSYSTAIGGAHEDALALVRFIESLPPADHATREEDVVARLARYQVNSALQAIKEAWELAKS